MPVTATGSATSFITFSRASTATRINASGVLESVASGVARLDYDPVTLAPRGLLVEEQRSNLLTESDFRNGLTDAPTRGGGALLTATTFYSYLQNTALGFGWDGTTTVFAYKSFTPAASTVYTMSVFVRMDDGNAPSFGNSVGASATNDFVLVVGGVLVPMNTALVQNMGNSCYRVVGTVTTNASPGANTGVVKYGGNTNRTFRVTGYQLEQASFATSYIPTLASSATRSADVASVATSSFPYNQPEGTIVTAFSSYSATTGATTRQLTSLNDGTGNERVHTYFIGGAATPTTRVVAGGVEQALISTSAISDNAVAKVAHVYKANDFAISLNGAAVQTDTSGSVPAAANILEIGRYGTGNHLNGHIRQITYIPRRLSNAELQARTA